MSSPVIPLRVASKIERSASWEGISTPYDLALYMQRTLSVDGSKIAELQEIIYSDLQPTGDDQKKIWVKTSEPIGLGLPAGDTYKIIYQYPPDVPILWMKSEATLPSYMRALTETEMDNCNLTAPKKGLWAIFTP